MSEGGPPGLVLTIVTQNKCSLSKIWSESCEQKVLSSGAAKEPRDCGLGSGCPLGARGLGGRGTGHGMGGEAEVGLVEQVMVWARGRSMAGGRRCVRMGTGDTGIIPHHGTVR